MDRRHLLASIGTAGFSGCLGSLSTEMADDGPVQSDASNNIDPTPTPWPTVDSCDGYEPVSPAENVHNGTVGGFSLTVEPQRVALGETLTVRLENTTTEEQSSGQQRKYVVEQRGPEGWTSIFWADDEVGWYLSAVQHQPGEGFVWELPVTESGLDSAHDQHDFRICRPIQPGQYRFVYFGVSSDEYDAVAAEFTVVQ